LFLILIDQEIAKTGNNARQGCSRKIDEKELAPGNGLKTIKVVFLKWG